MKVFQILIYYSIHKHSYILLTLIESEATGREAHVSRCDPMAHGTKGTGAHTWRGVDWEGQQLVCTHASRRFRLQLRPARQ
jgi:hypothetical protein